MFTPVGMGGRVPGSRPRRTARRLTGATLALALLAGGGFAVWRIAFNATDAGRVTACPQPAVTTAPAAEPVAALQPRQVAVNVYNATAQDGLAGRTAAELKRRGFAVGKVANDPLERHVGGVAELRSGPKASRQVALVQAHLPGAAVVRDRRSDATVDLVIGEAFQRLGTAAQVSAALNPAPTTTSRPC